MSRPQTPTGADPARRLGRGLLFGLAAALVTGAIAAVLAAVFNVGLGLIAVAAAGGWAIGTAVRGSWVSQPRPPASRVRLVAVACGLAAWLIGSLLEWVLSLALLQGSSVGLADRLAQTPFPTFLSQQLSIQDAVELLILGALAWRSTR